MAMSVIDFDPIVKGLARIQGRPGDLAKVTAAFHELRDLPIPPAYLDGMRDELYQLLVGARTQTPAKVYLSFYGIDRASYLKIGIAKNVRSRMSGIATGNPLPRLWTYTANFGARHDALAVESALLSHMFADKVHGEWVNVSGLSESAAGAVVESLAEVASVAHRQPVTFVQGF